MTRSPAIRTRRCALALASALVVLVTWPKTSAAQAYRIDTLLGDFDPLEEVPLATAWTENPVAVVIDAAGNIYFAESSIGRVRKIDRSGRVSTVAGSGLTGDSGDGGPATRARFGRIEGLAVDPAGNLYIADAGNYRIRRVDTSGTIETIVGTGEFGWDGDGGPAASASVTAMSGLATDRNGNLYIADTWSNRIRVIDTEGMISTIAGTGKAGRSGDGGPAVEARLDHPSGVAIDGTGIVYIADTDSHLVRRVDATGTISTFAGSGDRGYSGDGGLATEAQLSEPYALAIDDAGNVFIADWRNRTVRKVDTNGIITTVAGTPSRGGGTGTEAAVFISRPRALAVDSSGDVYIADAWGDKILRIDDAGRVSVLVGLGQREFRNARDVALDASGNAYVALSSPPSVVKVDPSGLVMPFAGTGQRGFSGDGGPAVNARFAGPSAVATDDMGNVYIADTLNQRIRMVDSGGTVRTVAGTGARGFGGDGGPATSARFNYPTGIAAGADGAVYVADRSNNRIRKIDGAGIVTTIAGNGQAGGPEPGLPAILAPLRRPESVDVDSAGRVYIPDSWTHRVYMVDSAGILRVAAGNGELDASGDGGPATGAAVGSPRDVAISDTDTLYIADPFSGLIRKVARDGVITTIAGTGERGYNGDGSPAREFHLRFPARVAASSDRRVLVGDTLDRRVRVLTAEVPPPVVSSVLNGASYSASLAPGSVAVILGADLSSYESPAIALPRSAPLPTSLLGTLVIVTDASESGATRREAGLYSVSPTEIRFQVPEDAPTSQVTVTVVHEGALSEPATVQVSPVAPGLFSANGDGLGVAAATAVRVARDGTRTPLEVYRYDPDQKRYVAVPLDVRATFSPVYLTLYGTGLRGGERQASVKIRGRHVTVESAGPASGFPGVDELVVGPIPRSIRRREVDVVALVDGQMSNAVTIAFK